MHGSLKITRRRGGQVLSFVTGLIASVGASANPQGAQVASGTAVFANPTPQTLEITNSPAAVLNWQSFDIGKGETTRFIQQNAASAVLNRVTTGNSSEILGNLISNGHVFLINPAGILIGRDGSVDTAGVVLSTLQITDQDFLNGRFHFDADNASGAITNHGYIKTAPGGEVVLIAPRIENVPLAGNAKSGLIESPNGDLVLAAGTSITIASLDDPDITFDVRAPDNEVVNLGRLLARGGTASILAGTIRHSGEINADSVSRDVQGRVSLKASNRISLADGSSIHASGGSGEDGGTIALDARNADGNATIDALGTVRADGDTGGKVIVRANDLLVDGIVSARGTNAGGQIDIKTTDATIATVNATLQTYSTEGQGGRIHIDGGKSAFTSGSIRASGERGGSVRVLADEVTLAAARIRADGEKGGGRVRIGGGYQGGEDLRGSQKTTINDTSTINANARDKGRGGDVVAWSDGATRFAGSIKARGGEDGGDGGRVEVSGREGVGFTGDVDVAAPNGTIGTLLLDPKNIRFTSEELPAAPTKLLDPHPGADNFFGSSIQYFDASGNRLFSFNRSTATTAVVFDSSDDFGGANAGAVYVYRLSDGALLSGLHGLTGNGAGDQIGNQGLDANAFNGQHVLRSTQWGGTAGALTVFDPVNGTSGTVDASNSLVGAAAGDFVGNSTLRFMGGNTVAVLSPSFNSATGAITIVTSAAGLRGTVSSSKSLVGANPGDQLGSNMFSIGGGNWMVQSANGGLGSITVLHAGTRVTGVVSASNSLVGSTSGDAIGNNVFRLGSSDIWVAQSSQWNGGVGAATWIDSNTTPTGAIGAGNSLIGAAVGDLGSGNAQFSQIVGNNYLMFSENSGAGAVTFVNPSSLPVGVVDQTNSLVGSLSSDSIGHDGNGFSGNFDSVGGKFAVYSPNWNNNAGAVTFGDITTGLTPGVVGAGNSLVGASNGDLVGSAHITPTGFGFGLLRSSNGGAGAVTVIDQTAPPTGVVDSSNSLVGIASTDNIGDGGINFIGGVTYAIRSAHLTVGGNVDAGAVTLFDAATGTFNGTANPLVGAVTASNSLVGTEVGDLIGSGGVRFVYSSSADDIFAVQSPHWANTPSVPNAGALTWFTLSQSLTGAVSSANSLVGGSTGDLVGDAVSFVPGLGSSSSGVYELFGSNNNSALFYSPTFGNGAGAVVHLNGGSAPLTGQISSGNALVGSTANDQIGSNGIYQFGDKYIVMSPNWDNFSSPNAGAVTIASASSGVSGVIGSSNSLIGDQSGDRVGEIDFDQLSSGNLLIRAPSWHGSTGAVTFVDMANGNLFGDTDFGGVISSTNSLIGINAGDNVGANGSLEQVTFGNYVLLSPDVSEFNGPQNVGAATFFSDLTGLAGEINSTNSLVGTHANDHVGDNGLDFLFNGNVLVLSSQWNGGAGAVTFLDTTTGHFGGSAAGILNGALSETNSLVGHSAGDAVGSEDIQQMFTGNGYYMVFSPLVDNTTTSATDAGAVTFGDMLQGVHGFVDDNTVSFVGTANNDFLGDNANTDSTNNGNVFLINPQWNINTGAVTFVDLVNGTGLAGDISSANSVVGSNSGDKVGIGGVQAIGNNHMVAILSPLWTNGGTMTDAGAITWGNELTGVSGVVDSTNSLLGSHDNDLVGNTILRSVSGTNLFYARTSTFDGDKSALTFIDSTAPPVTGVLDASNSLLGSTAGDNLGASNSDVFAVTKGATTRVVVLSSSWDNGATVDAGAITTFSASTPKVGVVSNLNSLVGTNTDDALGDGYTINLSSGNQLIVHSNWNNDRGAITFWNLSADLVGDLGASNSFVGANVGDGLGQFSPEQIAGTNFFMVRTPNFDGGKGALSFGNIFTGGKGTLGAANSLVGVTGDFLGSSISSGNFIDGRALLITSHGTRGAATFIDARNAPRGVVSAANSLVGSTAGDGLGMAVRNVTSTVRAVMMPGWDNGSAVDAGAVSMVDISNGHFAGTANDFGGRISAANSLVGTFAGDQVGNNGRFVQVGLLFDGTAALGAIFSANWNEGRGAITWFTPGEQLVGEVSATNSLVGSFANDHVGGGFGNPIEFFNTQSLPPAPAPAFAAVFTPNWNGNRGAITWFKPGERPVGKVTAKNSLVGAFADDFVGGDQNESFDHGLLQLPTGNFVLSTSSYNKDGGAVTFLNVARGLPVGEINSGNSFVGAPGDFIGSDDIFSLGGDRVLIVSPNAAVDGFANAGRIDLLDGSKTQSVDAIGFGSSSADDLAVSIPAVINFLNAGGTLTLQASNDILLPEGTNIFAKAGSLTLQAGRSIEVKGNIFTGGFLKLFANAPGGDASQRDAGEGFVSVLADTKPATVIAGQLEVDAEDVVIQGGNAKGAYALLYGLESAKIFAHGSGAVNLVAGTGDDIAPAPSFELLASLLPGQVADGNPITVDAPVALLLAGNSMDVSSAESISLKGGGSGGAFASIASFGELKVDSPDITLEVGSASNTDAVFLGMGGAADITFTSCTGCGDLLADPLLDGGSQTGTFLAGLFVDPTINAVLANILQSDDSGSEPSSSEDEDEKKKKDAAAAECH